jgi:hypothetical protein
MMAFCDELERVREYDDHISNEVLMHACVGKGVLPSVAAKLIEQFKKFRVIEKISLAQDGKESKRMLENITVDNFSTFKSKP